MKLATANIWAAVLYINRSFPKSNGREHMIASFDGLQENQPGRITFRLYRVEFPSKDTLGYVLLLLIAVLGRKYERTCTQDTEAYEWHLTPTRSIVVWYKKGEGSFIQLRDDAPVTGVEA